MKSREQIEAKKLYADNKKSSMKRRDDYNDYHGRRMYMITMEVEGRLPLFGMVVGNPAASPDNHDAPHIELSPIGAMVEAEWHGIPRYYPQIEVLGLQIMPDHLHGILFVHDTLPIHLSHVLSGFKKGCERKWRAMTAAAGSPSINAAAQPHPTPNDPSSFKPPSVLQPPSVQAAAGPQHSPASPSSPQPPSVQAAAVAQHSPASPSRLFALGYNDLLLKTFDELQRWKHYLADNPRRLLMKRARPEFLRPRFNVERCGYTFTAIGNLALLERPFRLQVRVSRRCSPTQIQEEVARYLTAAREGAVLVSPSISPGEKAVMRAAFDAHLPLIVLVENGFTPLTKPQGEQFDACAAGRLLLLAPWEHHNEGRAITAQQCQQLNLMAMELCR